MAAPARLSVQLPEKDLDPANSNDAGGVGPSDKPRLSLAERLDDGIVLGWAFRLILLGSVVVLALDLGELRDGTPDAPISPASRETMLPPALSDGEAPAPPHQITTDPDILKNAASFDLIGGGVLRVQGAIDPGAAARFETEIAARGEYVTTIVLNSPGGSVDDALRMSQIIRDNEFSTRVESGDLCASSCPLIMAGGVERSAEPEAVIGVHQVYGVSDGAVSSAEAMSRAQNVTARVSRHLAAMGIDQGLWLHALDTPPDRLYYLSPEELLEYDMVTATATAEATDP
jgi:hypothetical protein